MVVRFPEEGKNKKESDRDKRESEKGERKGVENKERQKVEKIMTGRKA